MNFRLTSRGVTVAAIGITALVVFIGVALAATSSPRFCAACKSHVPYVDEWRLSAHDGVNCEQCHTKPGPFFFLTAKLEALQQPIAADHGRLRRAHPRLCAQPVVPSLSRRRPALQARSPGTGSACTTGISSRRASSVSAATPRTRTATPSPKDRARIRSMDQCLICHNNEYHDRDGRWPRHAATCATPNRGYGAVPASHQEPDWSTRHGAVGVLSTCSACHVKKDACSKCHNDILMPHPDAWLYGARHESAEAKGRRPCAQCHNVKEYCKTCHQVPMPHPANFVSSHPAAAARAGAPTCFNCHVLDNCQACHEQHAIGRPAGAQPVRGCRLHPGPARDAHGDAGTGERVDRAEEQDPQEPRAPRGQGAAVVADRRPRRPRRRLRRGRHRLLGGQQHRHLRGLPRHPARGGDLQAVGALSRRRRLPEVPHQARRLQLPHPEHPGRHEPHPVRLRHVRAPHHHRRGHRQLRPVPPQVADRDATSVVDNIRVNHTGLREAGYQCLTCHANISPPRHAGSRSPARARTRCPSARAATTASSSRTTATSATSAACPPRRPRSPMHGAGRPRHSAGSATRPRSFCADCHNGLEMPHPEGWMKSHGAHRRRPRQEHLRLLPPQGRPDVLHRLPRARDAASGRLAVEPRRLLAGEAEEPGEVRQVPRQEQLHRVPRPADAASVRLAVHPLEHGAELARLCAASATATPSASAATASRCRTAARSSPITRTTTYNQGSVCMKCHGNGGTGPNGCYGGQCHSGSID